MISDPMSLYFLGLIAITVWTLCIHKLSRRNMISLHEYYDVKSNYDNEKKRADIIAVEFSKVKEQLAQRNRKIEVMYAECQELERKLSDCITKQARDSATIADLMNENLLLKQEIAKRQEPVVRKRSAKIGK